MIKKLKIAATEYAVKPFSGAKYSDYFGWCDSEKHIIHVNTSKKETATRTIFHEAIHSIIVQYGIKQILSHNEDELITRILEVAIIKFFQDNPSFTTEFVKSVTRK